MSDIEQGFATDLLQDNHCHLIKPHIGDKQSLFQRTLKNLGGIPHFTDNYNPFFHYIKSRDELSKNNQTGQYFREISV